MFSQGKIDADSYSSAIKRVAASIETFGLTSEKSAERLQLMKQRIADLLGAAFQYKDLANDYERQANEMISGNEQIKTALDSQRVSWLELSKQEKRDFAEKYKDYVADYKALTRLIDLADELRVKAADASKDASKLGSDMVRRSLDDPKGIYDDAIRKLGLEQQHEIFGLGRYANQQQKDIIALKYAVDELALSQQELNRIEKEYGKDSDKYKSQQVQVDSLKEKVSELDDTWQTVRGGMADLVIDMVDQGATLKQVWNKLWTSLANDAIKALFRVQNSAPSLLSQILGLFGGVSGGGFAAGAGAGVASNTANALLPTAFPHAQGGIFDREHLARLNEGNKKEAIIPLEDKSRGYQVWQAAGEHLGVVPYLKNPELAKQSSVSVQVQQSEKHIQALERQNELMIQQNQMIFEMLQSNNNGGGNTMLQPIVNGKVNVRGRTIWDAK